MAERRMFSKQIIDSDAFLDMGLSTQALYFHLSMRADDEGFIDNPKKVMRMIGAQQNELEMLLAKRYLLGFESGVVVIKHWKIHNYIQNDRFKETLYKEEKQLLTEKENRIYTDRLDTNWIQDGYADKIRIDKIRIDKRKVSKDSKPVKHKYGEYKNVLLSDPEYNKLSEEWGIPERDRMIGIFSEGLELKGYRYKSHYLALIKWKKSDKVSNKLDTFDINTCSDEARIKYYKFITQNDRDPKNNRELEEFKGEEK